MQSPATSPPDAASPAPPAPQTAPAPAVRWAVALAILFAGWALIALARYTAPPDLLDNDQWLTASYTVDIAANGEWIAQRDPFGRPATKPPLHPWLAAAISAPAGRVTWLTAGLPAALATLATALLAGCAARRWFGPAAGLFAGAATLASPVAVKHLWLVRPDAVFMLAVFVGALLTWRAWDRGRGWLWVWLAAAVVTLAKTPFGIPLMFAGLLAAPLTRAPKPEAPAHSTPPRRFDTLGHLVGFSLFVLMVAGWFLAARWRLGDAFTQTALGDELTRHALGARSDEYLGKGFLRAPWYLLARLAPWSALACVAMWRLWASPAADLRTRRLERFLFCAVVGGLLVVCFASRPRAEHILPFAPFIAILAAREVAAWPLLATRRRALTACAAALAVAAGAAVGQYHIERRDHPHVVTGRALSAIGDELRPLVQAGAAFVDVDAPYALQFAIGTMQVHGTPEDAAALLAGEGPALAFASAASTGAIGSMTAQAPAEIARWPTQGEPVVVVLANPAAVRLRTIHGR